MPVIADGQKHRCPVEGKPKGQDGEYSLKQKLGVTEGALNVCPAVLRIYTRDSGTVRGGLITGRANPATTRAIITDSQPTQRGHRPPWALARERSSLRTLKEKRCHAIFC
jgi:hypothetical protein